MSLSSAALPRVVVFGCGNPSRGDDALGPALMKRLEAWTCLHPDRSVAAVEDFQFQVEHTLDLQGRDLALFLDAAARGTDTVRLRRVAPSANSSFSTHALSPEALLQAFTTLGSGAPPPAFSLAVRGHDFSLGQPLSPQATRNLESAWVLLARLLESPSEDAWERMCTPGSSLPKRAQLEFPQNPRDESACLRPAPHCLSSVASPGPRHP